MHDPKFGTRAKASKCDVEADLKLRSAYKDGKLGDLFGVITEESFQCLLYVISYMIGRYWGIRGGEGYTLLWEYII